MNQDEEVVQLIHSLRNALNNITLQAEIARVKLRMKQDQAGAEEALATIVEECESCGAYLQSVHPDSATTGSATS